MVSENGKKKYPHINGLTGNESNPDSKGALVKAQPNAQFQSQLDPDPDHHFPGVDLQIFGGQQGDGRVANMQGFVKHYFTQTNDVARSHNIMSYFTPDKLPVLTTLATEFAVWAIPIHHVRGLGGRTCAFACESTVPPRLRYPRTTQDGHALRSSHP